MPMDAPKEAVDVCAEWIQRVIPDLAQYVDANDFQKSLMNGTILCELANAIQPGAVPKIWGTCAAPAPMPFKQMENISSFLRWVKTTDVRDFDIFTTNSLYTGDNMKQVVQCLHSLARSAAAIDGFPGPYIDANKIVDTVVLKKQRSFGAGKAAATGGPPKPAIFTRNMYAGTGKNLKDVGPTTATTSKVFGGAGNNKAATAGAKERDQKGVPDMFLRKAKTSSGLAAPTPEFKKLEIKPTPVVFKHAQKTVYVKVLHAFEARDDTELTLVPGNIIEILDKDDEGWWRGVYEDKKGLFPGNYTEPFHGQIRKKLTHQPVFVPKPMDEFRTTASAAVVACRPEYERGGAPPEPVVIVEGQVIPVTHKDERIPNQRRLSGGKGNFADRLRKEQLSGGGGGPPKPAKPSNWAPKANPALLSRGGGFVKLGAPDDSSKGPAPPPAPKPSYLKKTEATAPAPAPAPTPAPAPAPDWSNVHNLPSADKTPGFVSAAYTKDAASSVVHNAAFGRIQGYASKGVEENTRHLHQTTLQIAKPAEPEMGGSSKKGNGPPPMPEKGAKKGATFYKEDQYFSTGDRSGSNTTASDFKEPLINAQGSGGGGKGNNIVWKGEAWPPHKWDKEALWSAMTLTGTVVSWWNTQVKNEEKARTGYLKHSKASDTEQKYLAISVALTSATMKGNTSIDPSPQSVTFQMKKFFENLEGGSAGFISGDHVTLLCAPETIGNLRAQRSNDVCLSPGDELKILTLGQSICVSSVQVVNEDLAKMKAGEGVHGVTHMYSSGAVDVGSGPAVEGTGSFTDNIFAAKAKRSSGVEAELAAGTGNDHDDVDDGEWLSD